MAKLKFKKNNFPFAGRNGQTIIEAMIAIGVLVTGLLGSIVLLSNSLAFNRVVAENYTATYLATEGIEVMKNIIDFEGWGKVQAGSYEVEYDSEKPRPLVSDKRKLYFDSQSGLYSYNQAGTPTSFDRVVTLTYLNNDNELKVESVVSWQSRGGNFSVELEDHFYNWQVSGQ